MKTTALSLIVLVSSVTLPVFGQQGTAATAADSKFQIPATDEGLPGSGPIRRYDWFKNLWQKKRSGWAKDVEKDQNALVFLGDSITQGWGPEMGNAFPGVNVANRGISGDTTRGMLIRLKDDVLALNPEGVVMLMGTNDLEERAEPQTIAENFNLIIGALKKHDAEMPIVVCLVMPSSASKRRPADKIKAVNRLYSAAPSVSRVIAGRWSIGGFGSRRVERRLRRVKSIDRSPSSS